MGILSTVDADITGLPASSVNVSTSRKLSQTDIVSQLSLLRCLGLLHKCLYRTDLT